MFLDNDFSRLADLRRAICEICDGNCRVCFTQGINIRTIGEEDGESIASFDDRKKFFSSGRIYMACDNRKDYEAYLAASIHWLNMESRRQHNVLRSCQL